MKRFICIILSVILIFMFPVSIFAADKNDDGIENYEDWNWYEKLDFWGERGVSVIGKVIGLNWTGAHEDFNELMNRKAITNGYSSYSDFLARHTSYNQTTNNLEFDDEAMIFINDIKSDLEAQAEYMYKYPLLPEYISASAFNNRYVYDSIVDIIKHNSDSYFYLAYIPSSKNKILVGFKCNDLRAVSDGLTTNISQLYNGDTWEQLPNPISVIIVFYDDISDPKISTVRWNGSVESEIVYSLANMPDGYFYNMNDEFYCSSMFLFYENGSPYRVSGYNSLRFLNYHLSPSGSSVYHGSGQYGSLNTSVTLISSKYGAIPVFKSVAAMKNGTNNSVGIKPGDNYQFGQPITNNTISSTTINNIINNNTTNNNYGSDQDYTDVLNSILQQLQVIGQKLDGIDPEECDHSDILAYLQPLSAQLDSLYGQLSMIITKIDISNENTSDILAALNTLSGNIDSINQSLESIDAAMDKLDQMQETLDDMKELLQDTNDKVTDIKDILTGIDQDVSQMVSDITDINVNITNIKNNIIKLDDLDDLINSVKDIGDYIQALGFALVGDEEYLSCLDRVRHRSGGGDPDDWMLASVSTEAAALYDNNQSTFGGALGQVFTKLLDFQIGIDDLVQDEEYIDEVEQLLRDLLSKVDPDKDEDDDDSLFERILRQIELKLQLNANKVAEIEETSKTKFPFSIGYDLQALLLLFSAEPVAPVFHVPIQYEKIHLDYDFEIDFTQFSDAVDALRWFITVIWTFGLLKLTPSMTRMNNETD